MVGCQPTRWNHAMNVRMMLEFLVPGVQDAEESDLGAEMFRIVGDLGQRLGAGPEKQGIDLAFVLHREWRQLPRQCKNHVDVARGQQFLFPRCKPAVAGIRLTFWAMPVSAGVI